MSYFYLIFVAFQQTHYAELHTAYNLANQTLQNSTSTEFADRITKLQTALSVAIEEKTAYQSELRASKGKLTVFESENKALQVCQCIFRILNPY